MLGIAGLRIPDGVFTDTVAVFALPARTEVMVLLLTVCPLAIVVMTEDALLYAFVTFMVCEYPSTCLELFIDA